MDDNPYQESSERERVRINSVKPSGRMFVVGFLFMALGEVVQLVVRFRSPSILSDMMTTPGAGVKPSEIVETFQSWTMVSAIGRLVSLVGVALLLYTIWKRLSAVEAGRNQDA